MFLIFIFCFIFFYRLSLNLKQAAKPRSLSVDENSMHSSVPPTLSSSVGTADTFHTATSPCSGDEYGKKSNYSTSSFEKISPPTEIHNAQKLCNSYCNKVGNWFYDNENTSY